MKLNKNNSGFTLLEIVIAIIIVGVLASLALPKFFSTVEYSKSTEALTAMASLRQSMERCHLQSNETYVGCDQSNIDMSDPTNSTGSHFAYAIAGQTTTAYTITATRNTYDGGDGASQITLTVTSTGVTRAGTSVFAGIR